MRNQTSPKLEEKIEDNGDKILFSIESSNPTTSSLKFSETKSKHTCCAMYRDKNRVVQCHIFKNQQQQDVREMLGKIFKKLL